VLELSRRADFTAIERSVTTSTRPDLDGTAKVSVDSLPADTSFFYRFRHGEQLSPVGRFCTTPKSDAVRPLNLGFGGCANGKWAPFPAVDSSGSNNPALDQFVLLGDGAYGNAITFPDPIGRIPGNRNPIPPDPDPIASRVYLDALRQDIWTKMLLNLVSVSNADPASAEVIPGSLASLYANQAVLALPDNKDLGDNFLEAGGTPLAFLQGVIDGSLAIDGVSKDAEGTSLQKYFSASSFYQNEGKSPQYVNQSPEYQSLVQAFLDYLPVPDGVLTPSGPTAILKPLYGVTDWGLNARVITLDDRSYRDIKILDGNNDKADDDTTVNKAGADARDRTILGVEQLAWFKQQLLKAKTDGVLWTVVNISSPIDATGGPGQDGEVVFGETSVDAKSFWGNYRWERNEILRFIAENGIRNVIFLSSDDHEFRVNELVYAPNPDPSSDNGEGLTKNLALVPGVFTVVASPLGAARPDGFLGTSANDSESKQKVTNFTRDTIYSGKKGTQVLAGFLEQAQRLKSAQTAQGVDPIGLSASYAGLRSLSRSVNLFADHPTYTADVNNPQIQDFWSPQTFNWGQLQIDRQGLLTVRAWGINDYANDKIVNFDVSQPAEEILSFTLAPSIAWTSPVERDGATGLRFNADLSFTYWRGDSGEGLVNFGLQDSMGAQTWLLQNASGGQQGCLSPETLFDADPGRGWLASEGRSVGSRVAVSNQKLGGSTWTPIAYRDGRTLTLDSVTIEGMRVTARFQDGITGIISLPGSATAAAPANTHPLVTVQRLGANHNGLAFYETDPLTGAVGGLRPGESGYLNAALAQAEAAGRLVEPSGLPAYGATATVDGLNLNPGSSYGLLLLVNGDRSDLMSSYAAANLDGATQMLSLDSEGRGMVIGIEDQRLSRGPFDGDFNDLIVRVDSAVVRLA
jgi:alkaline phosphatase D